MPSVNSSLIRFVEYYPANRTLKVFFVSGSVYLYKNVPEQVYTALIHAPSKGQFFHSRIRDRYPYRKER